NRNRIVPSVGDSQIQVDVSLKKTTTTASGLFPTVILIGGRKEMLWASAALTEHPTSKATNALEGTTRPAPKRVPKKLASISYSRLRQFWRSPREMQGRFPIIVP